MPDKLYRERLFKFWVFALWRIVERVTVFAKNANSVLMIKTHPLLEFDRREFLFFVIHGWHISSKALHTLLS
jgi:hypothetical protein